MSARRPIRAGALALRLATAALAALILVAAAVQTYARGWWRFHYPARATYPVQGMDVSHHQGAIDWPAARGAGMQFVYLKATEGGDFVDPRFAANWRAATEAGLARGAYHFFSFCRDPELQADNFLRAVPRDARALPPAIDLEFGGNCASRPSPEMLCESARRFVERVESTVHKTMVVYATDEFITTYPQCLPGNPLWERAIVGAPPERSHRRWILWQFANRARIPGIVGPVDLDLFNGTTTEFDHFVNGD